MLFCLCTRASFSNWTTDSIAFILEGKTVGCVIKNDFALTNRVQNKFYRAIFSGIASVSLLLMVGCGDSGPETPPPTRATESPDNQKSGSASEENTPKDVSPEKENTSKDSPPETGTYDPSDFDSTAQKDPKEQTTDKPDPSGQTGNPFIKNLTGNGNNLNIGAILKGIPRERPKNFTEWELTDLKPAIQEKDGLLPQATLFFAKKYAGNPLVAIVLTKFLDPNFLNPETTSPDGEGNNANRNLQTVNLDQKMVELMIASLALNNTPEAAQVLRKIVEDKDFNIVHPQVATKTALEVLTFVNVDPLKNDKVLFTALVDPLEYRDLKASMSSGGRNSHNRNQHNVQRMSAEQLAQEAERVLKPIASENLRKSLAGYILRDSISAANRQKFRAWFTESTPENLLGQLKVYEANAPDPELLNQFEEYFTIYSGTAIARLLGILPRTPDLSLLGSTNRNTPSLQELKGWGSGGRSGNSPNGNDLEVAIAELCYAQKKNASPEEELIRLTKKLWGHEIASIVAQRLNARLIHNPIGKVTDEKNCIALASTMPLDKVRHALFKRCKNYYQQGPSVALGEVLSNNTNQNSMDPIIAAAMKASGGRNQNDSKLLAIDPGLLVTLKMLHREDPNAIMNTTRGVPVRTGGNGNAQHQWFYASQQLVAKMFAQCCTAATPPPAREGMIATATSENDKPSADPSLVDLHKDAQIVTRLDFKLPNSVQGPLGNLPMDPLEVHYIRIEEMSKPKTIANHYRRVVSGQERVLAGNMGWWFDSIKEGTTNGSRRSVDVVISPGLPKAVNPGGKRPKSRKKSLVPIVIQILTIETANPTIEK